MKIEVGKHYLYKRKVAINGEVKETKELVEVVDKPDGVTATVRLRDGSNVDIAITYLHEAKFGDKPAHYDTAIDTIAFAKANFSREQVQGFMRINAIKYLQRAGKKDSALSDLSKAAHYIQMLIEMEDEENEATR